MKSKSKMKKGKGPQITLKGPKTDMSEMGKLEKKLKKSKPKNNIATPVIKQSGEAVMKENAFKLAKHITKHLKNEDISKIEFYIRINEAKKRKIKKCKSMAEAVVDLEEILQNHEPEQVQLGLAKNATLFKNIPMISIAKHAPLQSEGKCLFRTLKSADMYATKLMNEGIASRLETHNWGYTVKPYTKN